MSYHQSNTNKNPMQPPRGTVEATLTQHFNDLSQAALYWYYVLANGMRPLPALPAGCIADQYLGECLLTHLRQESPKAQWPKAWGDLTAKQITAAMLAKLQQVARSRTFVGVCAICEAWPTALGDPAEAVAQFLESRPAGTSKETIRFYRTYLHRSIPILGLKPTPADINKFVDSRKCKTGGKHAYFRAVRAFFNWLYSPASGYPLKEADNPVKWLKPPKVAKMILPAQTEDQLEVLISQALTTRDKAIVATFGESGMRLSALANVNESDINWQTRTIKYMGKDRKEHYAPFGPYTEQYLRAWLDERTPSGANMWGINGNGIRSMLRRLEKATGVKCNPHSFRRGFASILRRAGVDSVNIKDLGGWANLAMVQRYTESVTFQDSLKRYKPPLGDATHGLASDVVPRPRIELGTRGFSVRCSTD